jgi:hypothetical protein
MLSTNEHLELCQRELAAIYALDTLRDSADTPEAFLPGCAQIIRSTLQPDLLQIVTLDLEDCPAQHITIERWRPASGARLLGLVSAALNEGQDGALSAEDGAVLVRALKVKAERLGVLVLGRKGGAWNPSEERLIGAMCSQIDSAMGGLRLLNQLQSRNKELETIYRLDRLMDATPDFDVALTEALRLLSETIGATWSCAPPPTTISPSPTRRSAPPCAPWPAKPSRPASWCAARASTPTSAPTSACR